MEKQIAKTDTTTKAVAVAATFDASTAPHIGADDLVIPKILPLHHQSDKAKDRNNPAQAGEFRDTVENKLFGSLDKPFDFIPLHMISFYAEYDVTKGGEGDWIGQVPVTALNENIAREETIGTRKIKRVKTYEAYVLIPEDIKTGSAFPYVLSFRMTSSRAGKTLLTQMYVRNKAAGKTPFGNACTLSLTEESNDKGDFFVQHVAPKRAATEEEQKAAAYWVTMITSGKVKKDDSDLHAGVTGNLDDVTTDEF